jgi:O-antigen biosynthesis protein
MSLVLILAKVLPEPSSSAAGSRILEIVQMCKNRGWKVAVASTAKASPFSEDLSALGIPFYPVELNNSSFDSFIRELSPQYVIFDRFSTEEQFGWRVAEQCPDTLRILDTEDLHGLRAARQEALNQKKTFSREYLINPIAFREIASIYRSDLSLIISNFEMQLLKDFFHVPEEMIFYLPFLVTPAKVPDLQRLPGYSARHGFMSIGNFLHEPNLDAVRYLHSAIWPFIRKQLPEAELFIYGAYTNDAVMQLNDAEQGFFVKGRVEHAGKAMREARVCLAPLRFGAGLKGKLFEAMLNGTPSVSTSIGAEGIQQEINWPGVIQNDAQKFADAAVELYTNQKKWELSVSKIHATLLQFKQSDFEYNFILKLETMLANLKSYRLKNFTGQMLNQQAFNSTKYMSLWIEEKSKKKDA